MGRGVLSGMAFAVHLTIENFGFGPSAQLNFLIIKVPFCLATGNL